jgi:hypothetical protein
MNHSSRSAKWLVSRGISFLRPTDSDWNALATHLGTMLLTSLERRLAATPAHPSTLTAPTQQSTKNT